LQLQTPIPRFTHFVFLWRHDGFVFSFLGIVQRKMNEELKSERKTGYPEKPRPAYLGPVSIFRSREISISARLPEARLLLFLQAKTRSFLSQIYSVFGFRCCIVPPIESSRVEHFLEFLRHKISNLQVPLNPSWRMSTTRFLAFGISRNIVALPTSLYLSELELGLFKMQENVKFEATIISLRGKKQNGVLIYLPKLAMLLG
jgi:hypothetical protein